jgi:ABC-2 type transport system permease protein
MQEANSIEEGQKFVQNEQVEDFIYFDENLSAGKQGLQPSIIIFSNNNDSETKLLVNTFAQKVNSSFILNKNEITSAIVSEAIEQTALSPTGRVIKDADKFPLFGLMEMLCYGALLGTFSVSNHRRRNTLDRINLTPTNKYALAGGQFIGNFFTLCPSNGFFVAYLMYVYGRYLHGNWFSLIIAFTFYTAIITALGMTAGYLSKKIGVSVIIIVCINILFSAAAFVGGLGVAHGLLKVILFLSPQYHTYTVITETIFNSYSTGIQLSLYSLAVLAAALLGVTLYLGRRRAL